MILYVLPQGATVVETSPQKNLLEDLKEQSGHEIPMNWNIGNH